MVFRRSDGVDSFPFALLVLIISLDSFHNQEWM